MNFLMISVASADDTTGLWKHNCVAQVVRTIPKSKFDECENLKDLGIYTNHHDKLGDGKIWVNLQYSYEVLEDFKLSIDGDDHSRYKKNISSCMITLYKGQRVYGLISSECVKS